MSKPFSLFPLLDMFSAGRVCFPLTHEVTYPAASCSTFQLSVVYHYAVVCLWFGPYTKTNTYIEEPSRPHPVAYGNLLDLVPDPHLVIIISCLRAYTVVMLVSDHT